MRTRTGANIGGATERRLNVITAITSTNVFSQPRENGTAQRLKSTHGGLNPMHWKSARRHLMKEQQESNSEAQQKK
jgi:hypothetical protein